MIIRPQDYEITFLEEHNELHKLILMEKPSLSSQNFNQSLVKILSIHKTNWKKKRKQRKKMWQEKVERNSKDFAKMEERLKRFGAGQERRCGKWIRINNSSSIAWLLRKNVPLIQSCHAVNGAYLYFCYFCVTHFEAKPLSWHYSSNCKWSLSLIWRSFSFSVVSLSLMTFIICLWDCTVFVFQIVLS